LPQLPTQELDYIQAVLAQKIEIRIPNAMRISDYVACVAPYRRELAGIVDSLIAEALNIPASTLTNLYSRLGTINEQMQSLSRNKRHLFYRASLGFARTNKALIASGLAASVLGLAGHYLGCGISVLSGAGLAAAKRFGKLKTPSEFKALEDEVTHTMRPYVHRLLAKYLDVDVRAVQLWDIGERLKAGISK
jgi:hypothetical protein